MRFTEPNPTISPRRSYVDLPSNTGIIGPLLTKRDLGKFVKRELPRASLPSFLHESTHHWCFQSAVGTAMAILYFRAMGAMAEIEAVAEDIEWNDLPEPMFERAVDPLTRYAYASRVIEPLFEGLALFAEFDLTGSSNDVWSLPLIWTSLFFGGESQDSRSVEDLMKTGRKLVADMHRSEQLIGRKIDVLLGSFRPSYNSYLAGYLTTKWLWHCTANQRPDFIEKEVFFVFLRNFVFCDLSLVYLLLEADLNEFHKRFAERILKRLQQLRSSFSDLSVMPAPELLPVLDGYEWSLDNPPPTGLVGIESSEIIAGQQAMSNAVEDIEESANLDEGANDAWTMIVDILNGRDMLVFDRCDVHVEVLDNGRARVNYDHTTGLFFSAGYCDKKHLWGTSGTGYAIMMLSRTLGVPYYATCFRGEVLSEIYHGSKEDQETLESMRSLAKGAGQTAEVLSAWNRYLEEWATAIRKSFGLEAPDPYSTSWLEVFNPGINALVDDLYGRLSMPPWLDKNRKRKALDRLTRYGLLTMFPKDRTKLLPVMVGWSLGGALERHLQALITSADETESIADIINDVNETARDCWGADLLVLEDGSIRCVTV